MHKIRPEILPEIGQLIVTNMYLICDTILPSVSLGSLPVNECLKEAI